MEPLRLVRFGPAGRERPGLLLADERIADLSPWVEDYDGRFFGEGGLDWLRRRFRGSGSARTPDRIDLASTRLGPPIARPTKLLAAAVNYRAHAQETSTAPPAHPVLFAKAVTAVTGPFDPIVLPPGRDRVDFEAELALVVGRRLLHPSLEEAREAIAGFLVMNDVSEREVQIRGGLRQWYRGKSFDTFAPLGPWLVPSGEEEDPPDLAIGLDLDGEPMQRARTSEMLFSCAELLAHAADGETLLPGDVVATGTPAGVGFTREPPRFLRPGDVVEAWVEGLGRQRNEVIASRAEPRR